MAREVTIGGRGALFIGEDKQISVHVKDVDGASVDATGWVGKLVVRVADDTPDPVVLEKAWTVSGVFSASANPQRLVMTLTDTETSALAAQNYRYAIKRTDDGSETVLAYGAFTVQRSTQVT